jgi:hypothetical protein
MLHRSVVVTLLIVGLAQSALGASQTSETTRLSKAAAAIKKMEGVYKTRFANSTVHDEKFVSEDILEIVPYGADKIYFRLHLEFFNAHLCDIFGIATYEDGSFVFHGPGGVSEEPCKLTITSVDKSISIDDDGGNCRSYSCGARGGYHGAGFPIASRREIRYLKLLKASQEYAEAITEFEDFSKGSGEKH